jgi:phage shock protein A
MKTQLQKQKEALARLLESIKTTTANLQRYEFQSKIWKGPVLTAKSTPEERAAYILLPKQNPWPDMIERAKKHLERMESEVRVLRNKIN